MKFAEMLRKLRDDAGLTQVQLADRAGIPVTSLRNHEQGQRLPSWSAVVKLARALGVPTDKFAECDEVAAERSAATAATAPKPAKKPTLKKPSTRPSPRQRK